MMPPSLALPEIKPFTIERSEVITITSENNEREYELYIKTPRSYSSEENRSYPLIFLNNGHYAFPLVSSITRQMSGGGVIEEPIIVGISYDKKTSWDISLTRDYTPTKSLNEKNRHSDEARKHSGGADDYLLFIEKELLPFLRKKYRINTQKEIYAGNSFGGLFGGFILKTKPHIFDYYILSDPSFWYHNRSIFDIQSSRSSIKTNILITSQSKETGKDCVPCMAKNAKDFSDNLKASLPAASIEYLIMENEIHETMFPTSISQGLLRFLRK
jgi:predicted alpha/beta superfamily hydrolase